MEQMPKCGGNALNRFTPRATVVGEVASNTSEIAPDRQRAQVHSSLGPWSDAIPFGKLAS
jgi:hypothetical protein